jgi:hypothetical protein
MYHDQGLPVLKSQGFGEAINITLGCHLFGLRLIMAQHCHSQAQGRQKF